MPKNAKNCLKICQKARISAVCSDFMGLFVAIFMLLMSKKNQISAICSDFCVKNRVWADMTQTIHNIFVVFSADWSMRHSIFVQLCF